jgi:hypothetical protein
MQQHIILCNISNLPFFLPLSNFGINEITYFLKGKESLHQRRRLSMCCTPRSSSSLYGSLKVFDDD